MSYKYQNKKTGKLIERSKPLSAKEKQDYILISWVRNMVMKACEIIKK